MTEASRNLAVRVATSLLLLPLVVWLLVLGGTPFALLVSAAAALCALEVNLLLAPPTANPTATPTSTPTATSTATSAPTPTPTVSGVHAGLFASVGAAFLLPLAGDPALSWLTADRVIAAVVVIALADALFFEQERPRAPLRVGLAVLGAAYPGILLSSIVRLRQLPSGAQWTVMLFVVTWLNDTGAYFAGRAFGRRKLFPRISPSKTWEGAVGGAVFSVAGAMAVKAIFLSGLPSWGAALIGLGASLLGPLGDLCESMLKRAFGRKDSGSMLPGHGGFLDRLDSLLFNAPFVLLCAQLL